MTRMIILSLMVAMAISCKTDKKSDTTSTTTKAKTESKYNLPALPEAEMVRLFNQSTYVDYIFYNLPFSLSQDNQPSIHANLKMISSVALDDLGMGCKPIGREFFHIGGEIVHEADLYFSEGCMGYVFLKDEKPIYANKLTEEGIKFYKNIINQSNKMTNQVKK